MAVLALVFFAAHARTLPRTLEDIDTINFAMGVESFDVSSHQPHPPGYPVYVGLAKISTAALGVMTPSWDRDRRAAVGLALWSVIAGALAAFVIAEFWIALGLRPVLAGLASLLAVAAPLFWFTASRPLTDTPGLVAALAVQTCFLRGLRDRQEGRAGAPPWWLWAALGTGFAIGLRSQTMWINGPLLVWAIVDLAVRREWKGALRVGAASAAGVLLWAVPLVWDTGGLGAYLRALGSQGAQDFSGVEMLATMPTWKLFAASMERTFAWPWQAGSLGDVVLVLSLAGLVRLALRGRRVLVLLVASFWPYLVFHLMFHETVTIRYALPIVVPVSGLAVVALSMLGTRVAIGVTAVLAAVSVFVAHPRLEAYARDGAPVFRAFQDMQAARANELEPPVVRMHHQVWWGVRRLTDWYRPYWDVGPQPFPGAREWQAVVRHWLEGATSPVWFLSELTRSDLALFDPRATRERGRYELQPSIRALVGGARLDGLRWSSLTQPGWMLGTGWSLTPEIAGMTSKDANGPHQRPADAFLRRAEGRVRVMIGGRYLAPPGSPAAIVTVDLDGRRIHQWTTSAERPWFVEWIDVPDGGLAGGSGPYAHMVVRATAATPGQIAPAVGLEQFDAAGPDAVMYALTDGWHEAEENPQTGLYWRWTTARSAMFVQHAGRRVVLTLAGESPLKYFDRAPVVIVRAGDREVARFSPAADFRERIVLPLDALDGSSGRVTIETDLTYVPGDRDASPDRRTLGLRLFRIAVDPE